MPCRDERVGQNWFDLLLQNVVEIDLNVFFREHFLGFVERHVIPFLLLAVIHVVFLDGIVRQVNCAVVLV